MFLGALSTDVHLHDTYFVVAHFHYTMMGGVLMAFLGGLHYWWPKMFGRMYNERLAKLASWLIVVGFNVTFLAQFIMGSLGMPRRYYNYRPEFTSYHQWSTAGAYLQAIGFILVAAYLIHSLVRGRRAPANPWGSATLEWRCSSPPPTENFATPPPVRDPYDLSAIVYDPKLGGYACHEEAAGGVA